MAEDPGPIHPSATFRSWHATNVSVQAPASPTHSLDLVQRYSDRAALLLEGRIARLWNKEALDALRACPEGLEAALAAASAGAENL